MAASAKTAIAQLVEGSFNIYQIETALEIQCWTESLDLTDYLELHDIAHHVSNGKLDSDGYQAVKDKIIAWAKSKQAKYIAQWEELDQPRTLEAWQRAKYPCTDNCEREEE